ncbi:mutator type transposase [Tanacetum coccineum]
MTRRRFNEALCKHNKDNPKSHSKQLQNGFNSNYGLQHRTMDVVQIQKLQNAFVIVELRSTDNMNFCELSTEGEGGRELLGLDGAFMRGQYPGQMLTTVGVDANNGIYPIAYGIVKSENQYSWTWFLTCLADDLDLFSNSNYTFITDRQKGYYQQLQGFSHLLSIVKFQKHMQELKDYNKKAFEWLNKISPEHWSKAYFSATIAFKESSSAFLDLSNPGIIAIDRAHIGGSTQEKIGQID